MVNDGSWVMIVDNDIYIYIYMCVCVYRTGWWLKPTPLKNMKVNWDDDILNIWENKKCSKPPTSN